MVQLVTMTSRQRYALIVFGGSDGPPRKRQKENIDATNFRPKNEFAEKWLRDASDAWNDRYPNDAHNPIVQFVGETLEDLSKLGYTRLDRFCEPESKQSLWEAVRDTCNKVCDLSGIQQEHGDMLPQNIWVKSEKGDILVKLTDPKQTGTSDFVEWGTREEIERADETYSKSNELPTYDDMQNFKAYVSVMRTVFGENFFC